MKRTVYLWAFLCLLVLSCTRSEEFDFAEPVSSEEEFYASFEVYPESKVYVDEDVKLLWNADDRISIFNKITYNQEYRFTGETGDNAGGFKKVENDDFATGNAMSDIVAVYPYLESTKISNQGVLTVTMPSEQSYLAGSFGPGANTMVSTTEDNLLLFKNLGGYLVLKFYGEDVSVASVKLEGNNGEVLSGAATLTPAVGTLPSVTMSSSGGTAITLTCEEPVALGTTKEDATPFWLVVPPTEFEQGFTLTVTDTEGNTFVKETSKDLTISRNGVLRISAIEVEMESVQNNVIYYTSSDGEIVTPNASDVFGANLVSNEYVDGQGIMTFDGEVTYIGNYAFRNCTSLTSIILPEGVTSIETHAFSLCTSLTSITLPEGVTSIGAGAFISCKGLTDIIIPASVSSIDTGAFRYCTSLSSLTHYGDGITIGYSAFEGCVSLKSFSFEGISEIRDNAFSGCLSLDSIITLPETLERIGKTPFKGCTQITSFFGSHTDTSGQMLFNVLNGSEGDYKQVVQILPSIVDLTMPDGIYCLDCPLGDENTRTVTLPSTAIIGYSSCIAVPDNVERLTFGDGFSFDSCSISALPVGCEIYSEYASQDHSCLIVNNAIIAFSYPRTYCNNEQCYKLPENVRFEAEVSLPSNYDYGNSCPEYVWGLVFPSSVEYPEQYSHKGCSIAGEGISLIFESGDAAFYVLDNFIKENDPFFRVIIPEEDFSSGEIGGCSYEYDNTGIWVCPFRGQLPSSGEQMIWYMELDSNTEEEIGYYTVINYN